MIDIEEIVQRLDRRENAKVVAYREVGLPVFRLNSLVTLQEAGSLGAIEEFVLRCLTHAVDTSGDIERLLGLPHSIVVGQLGSLAFDGAISQIESSPPRYALTKRGRTLLEDSVAARLTKEQMPIYIDGITRTVVSANPQDLWTNQQLDGLDIAVVPPIPRRSPRASDVDLAGVNRMIGIVSGVDRPSKRAVRFDAIIGRISLQFRRAITMAYKSDDRKQISISFAVDGRSAEDHDIAFARAETDQRSILYNVMLDADRRRREAQIVAREFRSDMPGLMPTVPRAKGTSILTLKKEDHTFAAEATDKIKPLRVYEHPPLLERALQVATSRLLIISPRIRARVVDAAFIAKLTHCLDRGVHVTIAFATGRGARDEHEDDGRAREALLALSSTYPHFQFVGKGDTRARVLLVDRLWFAVSTFDWLSYRGETKQAMREEEGTLIEDPKAVEAYFQRISTRLVGVVDKTLK